MHQINHSLFTRQKKVLTSGQRSGKNSRQHDWGLNPGPFSMGVIVRISQQVQSNIFYTGQAGRPSRSVRYGQELPLEMDVLRNNWSLKAGKGLQNNEKCLGPFLHWEFKFQSVGGKKKTPPILFLKIAWIETLWNLQTTAIDCHTKRFYENNPAKTLHYTW